MTTNKAAIYLRISADPTGQHLGVDRQREDCLRLAAAKGWTPIEYLDNDVSATSGRKRPAYQQMITDIADGRIDAVLAWDLDRLYRQPRELEDLIDLADGKRLQLATVTGDCDLSTDNGRLYARIKGAVGKSEGERKSARQRRAALQKAEHGKPQWRHAFGYLPPAAGNDTGDRELDPVTAPLVARAYAQILAGASLGDVCRLFNDADAHGLKGQPWTATTASLFLRSPRNAALRTYHGEIIGPGAWPALVDESTWRAAQSVLNAETRAHPQTGRTVPRKPGPKSVRRHLLTGLLTCGKCGYHLSGQWAGENRITYSCKACRGVSVRAEHIEPLVGRLVVDRLAMPDATGLLRSDRHDTAEAEALRVRRQALTARLDEIADERADGFIDGYGYRRMTARIEREIEAIDAEQADAERSRILDDIPLGTGAVAEAIFSLSPDRFRAVIAALMSVTIRPVGKGHRGAGGQRFDPDRIMVAWRGADGDTRSLI